MALILRLRPLTSFTRWAFRQSQQQSSKKVSLSAPVLSTLRVRRVGSGGDKERNLMLKDNVPEGYELIYRAPMENYVVMTKIASTITASLVALVAGYQMFYMQNAVTISRDINWFGLVGQDNDIWYFAGGFIAINIAIRWFVAKYPLRIYKNVEQYVAVYDSQIPFLSTHNHFLRGEVRELNNIFNPWTDSTYRLGKKSSLLLLDYFKTPSEFHQMCGLK